MIIDETIRPPATFKGSDKYRTLFGPPANGNSPAWAQKKQDELATLHEKYERQRDSGKALSRDAAWEEKRRKFLGRRAAHTRSPLVGALGDQHADKGQYQRKVHDERSKRELESHPEKPELAAYASSGKQTNTNEAAKVDADNRDDGSRETSKSPTTRWERRYAASEAVLAGIGEHEEIARTVKQREKENLQEYLKRQADNTKVKLCTEFLMESIIARLRQLVHDRRKVACCRA